MTTATDRENVFSVAAAELPAPHFSFTVNASFSRAHLTKSYQWPKAGLVLIHGRGGFLGTDETFVWNKMLVCPIFHVGKAG